MKYLKINSVNPLHLLFSKVKGYFEEIDKNKYMMLVPNNESKEKIKKYEELLIRIINKYYTPKMLLLRIL